MLQSSGVSKPVLMNLFQKICSHDFNQATITPADFAVINTCVADNTVNTI